MKSTSLLLAQLSQFIQHKFLNLGRLDRIKDLKKDASLVNIEGLGF